MTMRIMICGDWHGNARHAEYCFLQAKEHDVDVVFQLGDFGYWEHTDGGMKYLYDIALIVKMFKIPLYWIDGNHENHVMLAKQYTNFDENGFVEIRDNVFYSPRGNVWKWDGVKFLSLGGAFSIDRNFRRPGTSFWFEETITQDDVDVASKNGKDGVDVMLCHDVLTGVDLHRIFWMMNKRLTKSRESDINRDYVREVALATRPRMLFHGHYHVRYKDHIEMPYGDLEVHGLNCDESYQDSWAILDTATA